MIAPTRSAFRTHIVGEKKRKKETSRHGLRRRSPAGQGGRQVGDWLSQIRGSGKTHPSTRLILSAPSMSFGRPGFRPRPVFRSQSAFEPRPARSSSPGRVPASPGLARRRTQCEALWPPQGPKKPFREAHPAPRPGRAQLIRRSKCARPGGRGPDRLRQAIFAAPRQMLHQHQGKGRAGSLSLHPVFS